MVLERFRSWRRLALGELVGYARVSTDEQNLALQLDALDEHGCTRVFRDVGSGSLKHRPQLDAALDYLRAGQDDVLVVWRLDRPPWWTPNQDDVGEDRARADHARTRPAIDDGDRQGTRRRAHDALSPSHPTS
jgi:hypothetical protein